MAFVRQCVALSADEPKILTSDFWHDNSKLCIVIKRGRATLTVLFRPSFKFNILAHFGQDPNRLPKNTELVLKTCNILQLKLQSGAHISAKVPENWANLRLETYRNGISGPIIAFYWVHLKGKPMQSDWMNDGCVCVCVKISLQLNDRCGDGLDDFNELKRQTSRHFLRPLHRVIILNHAPSISPG